MTNAQLSKDEVQRIRTKLGWSRPTLGRRMGVSDGAVRAWEDGRNPCQGAAAILLRLLERDPLATSRVLEPSHDLPSPHADAGTEEWFRLQRLLWLMSSIDSETASFWAALVATEGLHRQWFDELEEVLLIGPAKARYSGASDTKHPGMRATTEAAVIRFHLGVFGGWLRETWEVDIETIAGLSSATLADPSAIASVPVMDASALKAALSAGASAPQR